MGEAIGRLVARTIKSGPAALLLQAVAVAQQLPSLRELHLRGNGIASLHLPQLASAAAAGASAADGAGLPPHQSPSCCEGTASSTTSGGEQYLGGTQLVTTSSSSGGGASFGHSGSALMEGASQQQQEQLLAAAFSRLEVLDLEDSCIGDWGEVQQLRALPALRALLLSGNQLRSVEYSSGEAGGAFHACSLLVELGSLLCSLAYNIARCLLCVTRVEPSLTHRCPARTASRPPWRVTFDGPATLRRHCGSSLSLLQTFATSLLCRLMCLPLPAGFTSLTSLLLGRNRIADWASVDQLDRFPALVDTRLTDNPLLDSLGSSGRYEVRHCAAQ